MRRNLWRRDHGGWSATWCTDRAINGYAARYSGWAAKGLPACWSIIIDGTLVAGEAANIDHARGIIEDILFDRGTVAEIVAMYPGARVLCGVDAWVHPDPMHAVRGES